MIPLSVTIIMRQFAYLTVILLGVKLSPEDNTGGIVQQRTPLALENAGKLLTSKISLRKLSEHILEIMLAQTGGR
jgi:hypothetical protein